MPICPKCGEKKSNKDSEILYFGDGYPVQVRKNRCTVCSHKGDIDKNDGMSSV